MHITPNESEARCYETLCALIGDRERAWSFMLRYCVDGKSPIPSYSEELEREFGLSGDAVDSLWHAVREAFDKERISYSVIKEGDELFPENLGEEKIHYIYAAGNIELLRDKRVTVIGMTHPSLQGKSDVMDFVKEAVSKDIAILAPLDTGLGAFALSAALKENGKAIAMVSGQLSKCPSEGLLELQGEIYSKGLLLSIFAPSVKVEKWHVVFRNRYLSGISKAVFLAEEKDGGPSWAIFDPAMDRGCPVMLSSSISDSPSFIWARERARRGALVMKRPGDLRKLIPQERKRERKAALDLTPSLFDDI